MMLDSEQRRTAIQNGFSIRMPGEQDVVDDDQESMSKCYDCWLLATSRRKEAEASL